MLRPPARMASDLHASVIDVEGGSVALSVSLVPGDKGSDWATGIYCVLVGHGGEHSRDRSRNGEDALPAHTVEEVHPSSVLHTGVLRVDSSGWVGLADEEAHRLRCYLRVGDGAGSAQRGDEAGHIGRQLGHSRCIRNCSTWYAHLRAVAVRVRQLEMIGPLIDCQLAPPFCCSAHPGCRR